jgi:hypothetical protein
MSRTLPSFSTWSASTIKLIFVSLESVRTDLAVRGIIDSKPDQQASNTHLHKPEALDSISTEPKPAKLVQMEAIITRSISETTVRK